MSKTSSAVKDRYNAKTYDSLLVRLPKGTKEVFQSFCQSNGDTMNGVIVKAVQQYIEQHRP